MLKEGSDVWTVLPAGLSTMVDLLGRRAVAESLRSRCTDFMRMMSPEFRYGSCSPDLILRRRLRTTRGRGKRDTYPGKAESHPAASTPGTSAEGQYSVGMHTAAAPTPAGSQRGNLNGSDQCTGSRKEHRRVHKLFLLPRVCRVSTLRLYNQNASRKPTFATPAMMILPLFREHASHPPCRVHARNVRHCLCDGDHFRVGYAKDCRRRCRCCSSCSGSVCEKPSIWT